ncbi:MAG: NFACT family protein, partial [Oscillibacter sp.]|nr:NFACT family protein [Oscillibacter sp.]
MAEDVRENRLTPIFLRQDGKPLDCTWFPVLQYGPAGEGERYPSFCALLDAFLGDKERRERARVRGAELVRTASTARDRLRRKLDNQERDYAATQDRDALRMRGDLITANLYRMERGARVLVCDNFYDPAGGQAEVPLDPLLTPQQNAAKYYKRYAKAKTAEKYLSEQMA